MYLIIIKYALIGYALNLCYISGGSGGSGGSGQRFSTRMPPLVWAKQARFQTKIVKRATNLYNSNAQWGSVFIPHLRIESWINPLYLTSKIRVFRKISTESSKFDLEPLEKCKPKEIYYSLYLYIHLLSPYSLRYCILPLFCFAINIRALHFTQLLIRNVSL